MMDNASALPTSPQRQQHNNNNNRRLFKNGPKSPTRLHEEAKKVPISRACAVDYIAKALQQPARKLARQRQITHHRLDGGKCKICKYEADIRR
jgi:hypothetical protein